MKAVLVQLAYQAGTAIITLAAAWFKKKHDLSKLKNGDTVINDELKIVNK